MAYSYTIFESNVVDEGIVRVMKWDETYRAWAPLGQDLVGDDRSRFGRQVALSGNGRVLAILQQHSEPGSGQIKVYDYDATARSWVQRGLPLFDDAPAEISAVALSNDGRVAAGGFSLADPNGITNAGTVVVYRWEDSTQQWAQDFTVSSGQTLTNLGESIDLSADGTRMIVGTSITANRFGYFRVYQRSTPGVWTQQGPSKFGQFRGDKFGERVSMSYDGLVVAAAGIEDTYLNPMRYVRVYQWNGSTWAQRGEDIAQATETTWKFSRSMSLSSDGNIIAIGNPYQIFENRSSVSVLVFDESIGDWVPLTNRIFSPNSFDLDGRPILFSNALSLSGDGRTLATGGYPYDLGLGFSWDGGTLEVYSLA